MKRLIFIFSVMLGLVSVACTEEDYTYNDPTDIAVFGSKSLTLLVTDEVEDADNVMDVPVVSPVISDTDRRYLVKIRRENTRNEAVQNLNYEFVSSAVVTIPAGEYTGNLKVRVYHTSLLNDMDMVAHLRLESMDENHPVAAFGENMDLYFNKVCVVSIPEIAGVYNLTTMFGPANNDKGLIKNIRIEADPEFEDGLLIIKPYTEENVRLQLWKKHGDGKYSVRTREELFLTQMIAEDGTTADGWGGATGTYDACSGKMLLNFFIHPYGNMTQGQIAQEEFVRKY